ncbi:hypothetical protein DFH07DRAFT_765294 [Mycena maculata]|uniref:Ribonuclease H1 N-terminal domain-containing protein n=1 Tax=Mycena maculata TaxID=230809 RepID=A0AAD7NY64_9AGAR|nr:hypothetical protein DFH07DRAFT_765294 [Mycena maculata]
MTTDAFDDIDPEFLALLAGPHLRDLHLTLSATPSQLLDCAPTPLRRLNAHPSTDFSHPVAQDPAIIGFATQGVPGATVRKVQTGGRRKQAHTKKAAYVVFSGIRCGVMRTWDEAGPLVLGVPCSIYRGYSTKAETDAAFRYAQERSWVRVSGSPPRPIPALPQPAVSGERADVNPLNGAEQLDDRWFVVYRGIIPGVYRSHLECQLNTLGVPNTIHEVVVGRAAAHAKFAGAGGRGHAAVASAPVYSEDLDVFT